MYKWSLLVFLSIMSGVSAFKVNPMQMELSPKNSQGFFTVVNNTEREEIVLVKATTRTVDKWGNETNDVCNDFVIYPSHLVIKAGEQRLVRLIWKNAGKEKFDAEKNFRMIFEQSLVNLPKTEVDIENRPDAKTSIGFGVKYVASLYVKPHEKIKPKIAVVSYAFEKKEGTDFFVLELENQGSQHKVFSPRTLEVNLEVKNEKGSEIFSIPDELISQMERGINVLAGQRRVLEIPVNKEVPRDVLSVTVRD